MSGVENMFLGMGFSWTMSKALPYILAVVLGLILIYFFRKQFKKKLLLKWAFRITLLVIPFAGYFMYSPIYEGDFSNNSSVVEHSDATAELTGKKLVVLSIPNCPFCYESIDRIIKLKERVPNAEIEYVVSSLAEDSSQLEWYQEKGGTDITVRFADSSIAMSTLADGRFPTFILVDGKKPLKKWTNDSFGVLAMDDVELLLK